MAQLRILVADDSQFMRIAYRRILDTQDNFEVVAMAADGEEALQKGIELAPDVAILDIRMPKMTGLETAHRLISRHPNTAIVIISAYDDPAFVEEFFGTRPERKAYLLKNSLDDIGELIRVVETVVQGQIVLDPTIVERLARQSRPPFSRLAPAEGSVLELLAEGYDDAFIAQSLAMSQEEIAQHVRSLYEKLGLPQGTGKDQRLQAVLAFVHQANPVG